jgi:hypothetical protein
MQEAPIHSTPSVNLRAWVGWCVPGGCGIDMNVFLLLRHVARVECAQCYRNPVRKLTL